MPDLICKGQQVLVYPHAVQASYIQLSHAGQPLLRPRGHSRFEKTTLVAPLKKARQTKDVGGEKENTHKVFPASAKAAKVAESISAGSTFTGAGNGQEIRSRHGGGGNVDRRA